MNYSWNRSHPTKSLKPKPTVGRPRKRRRSTSKDDDGSFGFGTEIAATSTSKGRKEGIASQIDRSFMESVEYFHRVTVSTRQLQDLGWSDARIKAYAISARK